MPNGRIKYLFITITRNLPQMSVAGLASLLSKLFNPTYGKVLGFSRIPISTGYQEKSLAKFYLTLEHFIETNCRLTFASKYSFFFLHVCL